MQSRLDDLRAEAFEKFGVDDIAELERMAVQIEEQVVIGVAELKRLLQDA